jgi:hypothetical protein
MGVFGFNNNVGQFEAQQHPSHRRYNIAFSNIALILGKTN